jgi:hypothetical protein
MCGICKKLARGPPQPKLPVFTIFIAFQAPHCCHTGRFEFRAAAVRRMLMTFAIRRLFPASQCLLAFRGSARPPFCGMARTRSLGFDCCPGLDPPRSSFLGASATRAANSRRQFLDRSDAPRLPGRISEPSRYPPQRDVARHAAQFPVLDLIGRSQFLLLPTFSDTFGYSAIEAMARYTAVIATDIGALPEFVEDQVNGILLPFDKNEIGEWKYEGRTVASLRF